MVRIHLWVMQHPATLPSIKSSTLQNYYQVLKTLRVYCWSNLCKETVGVTVFHILLHFHLFYKAIGEEMNFFWNRKCFLLSLFFLFLSFLWLRTWGIVLHILLKSLWNIKKLFVEQTCESPHLAKLLKDYHVNMFDDKRLTSAFQLPLQTVENYWAV